MTKQLELFAWADARPSNVIDAVPALIRKAAIETMYAPPRPKDTGDVISLTPRAA
ncbi:hypothetical protein [Mesorhizobium sp. Pch-S]|uniref:hypothetical protein n=1 Tax=Mesorhizobium sp. Pch-S TaxID=2082387 RepID=UPI0013ED81A6|nr:hypothetical protein [Mesorhizobium sp. Pch-S]